MLLGKKRGLRRFLCGLLSGAMVCGTVLTAGTTTVNAEEPLPKELLLGVFFNSQEDQSDTLYVSFDALEFRKIGYAFEDSNKSSSSDNEIIGSPHLSDPALYPSYVVNCLHDPSLQYYNGNYWSMSGFTTNRSDGTHVFVPMLASSPNLVDWTFPNSGSSDNIVPTLTPLGKSGNRDNGAGYDIVAPDLLIEEDGTAWIVVCMGYYSQFHGDESKNDKMSPYLIKVTGLQPGSTNPTDINQKGKAPILTYSDAMPINLPVDEYQNRIDGSLYKENGTYYLSIKDNGVTNEIWSIGDLNNCQDSSKWTRVNKNVVTGYEGPWLTKYMGRYYFFTDQLETYPPDAPSGKTGIHMSTAAQLNGDWLKNREITTIDVNGNKIPNRHGAVITVTDPAQIQKIMNLYYNAGWTYNSEKDKPGTADCIWGYDENGKAYWYENGVIQGKAGDTKNIWDRIYNLERGREIADLDSNAWYWLDSVYNGAAAYDKEVWMPYIYQDEANFSDEEIENNAAISGKMADQVKNAIKTKTGKWVRYDYKGKMIKGWYMVDPAGRDATIYPDQVGNIYYYDPQTGLMAKGYTEIWDEASGKYITHHFDETTGVLITN